ncbi:YjcZ family sporulation protein [Bacillus sinesaloumensis]|uniref:YjcZ family sporulation protein n=1 Tax=Litchfieldia sinesaloumensis TaxID=1926280 RepID=UPI0009887DB6|nr:YjcZ family sporulation protein [Bacillus sinesaloumensis]
MELNVSNVNAASFQTPYVAPQPQPTYTAPSYAAPSYGYGYACHEQSYDPFVLIVVLFILLIIVGACFYPKC